MVSEGIVDLAFPITPGHVPMNHGYHLYSALSGIVPELHGAAWLGIHPLSGRKLGEAALLVTHGSAVTLRLPAERIPSVLSLAGKTLRLGDTAFALGQPTLRALEPCARLFSRQVALRLTTPPKLADGALDLVAFRKAFEVEANRQLACLSVAGSIAVLAKRVVHVRDQRVIAFSVEIRDLTEEHSLLVQMNGLGGKRRMGCGVFSRARSKTGA